MALNTAGQTNTGFTAPLDPPHIKVGRIVMDATSITATDHLLVELGFTPKYIKWDNVTDRIMNEWYEGMAAESAVNTLANGTRALNTSAGFTVCDIDGNADTKGRCIKVLQNATLGAVLASKVLTFIAIG